MSASGLTPIELEAAIAEAKTAGFEVVQSAPNLLLLDLDTAAAYRQYERVMPLLQRYYEAVPEETESKSGNIHVVVRLGEDMPVMKRIAWQAALGSDGIKEALATLRVQEGCGEPCLLFRPIKRKHK